MFCFALLCFGQYVLSANSVGASLRAWSWGQWRKDMVSAFQEVSKIISVGEQIFLMRPTLPWPYPLKAPQGHVQDTQSPQSIAWGAGVRHPGLTIWLWQQPRCWLWRCTLEPPTVRQAVTTPTQKVLRVAILQHPLLSPWLPDATHFLLSPWPLTLRPGIWSPTVRLFQTLAFKLIEERR